MPDAAKPKKGSKRDASSPPAEDVSQGTEAQGDSSTEDVAASSPGDEVSPDMQPDAGAQGTEAQENASTADTTASALTGQEELTRQQLERLRSRLKTRFHS